MAIHKAEGLVTIKDKCESTIPGLNAARGALGSYMAGGYTQIGSSLAGSAVQGAIAAEAAAEYCKSAETAGISKTRIKEIQEEILTPLKREARKSPNSRFRSCVQKVAAVMFDWIIPNTLVAVETLLNFCRNQCPPMQARHTFTKITTDQSEDLGWMQRIRPVELQVTRTLPHISDYILPFS